jgi:hypothetical protein
MTPPAVSAPPPPAAPRAAAPAPAPSLRPRAPFSRARHARPPLLTGRTIGISLGIHLLLLLAVLLAPRPERVAVAGGPAPAQNESVEYLEVGEWGGMATDPDASLPEPAPVTAPTGITAAAMDSVIRHLPRDVVFPTRVPAGIPQPAGGAAPAAGQPGGVPGGQGAQPGGAGQAGPGRSGPGGLGPELGDPRLVVTPTAVPERIPTDEERYQEHFANRIRAVNDSIAGEADRARRATDWTITDRNGRKWGINERGPVLGGRNVPIPVPVPVPRSARDREDEARRERDQKREIDRAIRERNNRERAQGGGSAPTPDP